MYSGNHGGLKEPSWPESIAALYIIYISSKIKSKYYKLIFFLNGLSSSLTHSPFISKNFLNFQKKMNAVDGITIFFPLVYELIKKNNEKKNINTLLYAVLFNLFKDITTDFKKLSNYTNIILFIKTYRKFSIYSYFILFSALLTKYYEETYLLKFNNIEIKMHSAWHIIGAHMFKEILEIRQNN